MKFLCDEMLKKLGQWLRVAGFDVLILPDGTDDRLLIERAHADERLLLTRDRKMKEFRNSEAVVLLECNGLEDCITELNHKLGINWLYRPFTRCKLCNTLLEMAPDDVINQVPENVRSSRTKMCYCPNCKQVFWHGGHVSRMRNRLKRWNNQG